MQVCDVCFRQCNISEGKYGLCGARTCRDGIIAADNYGKITSAALDPIEKKPLKMFRPGKKVLSIGSYGCNLRCPFCQNSDISWSKVAMEYKYTADYFSPEEIVERALELRARGNIGVAFTYNEPLVGYEYVRDTARLSKEAGMENVLVTNGTASLKVYDEIKDYIDAMNIDLKAFSERFYKKVIDGDFDMVRSFIENSVQSCHVELTTLIIPDENDSEDEMYDLSGWVASLEKKYNKSIPLHITRFFPRFHMTDKDPTPVARILKLVEIAKQNLKYVFPGNV